MAKDALGNDVKATTWLATHAVGDRSLTQGLKVRTGVRFDQQLNDPHRLGMQLVFAMRLGSRFRCYIWSAGSEPGQPATKWRWSAGWAVAAGLEGPRSHGSWKCMLGAAVDGLAAAGRAAALSCRRLARQTSAGAQQAPRLTRLLWLSTAFHSCGRTCSYHSTQQQLCYVPAAPGRGMLPPSCILAAAASRPADRAAAPAVVPLCCRATPPT